MGNIFVVLHRSVHLCYEFEAAETLLDLLFIVEVVGSLDHEDHREDKSDRHGNKRNIKKVIEPVVVPIVKYSQEREGSTPKSVTAYQE